MECVGVLLVFLLVGAVFGPPIFIWDQGSKVLKENLSDHDQRDFFIGFFGIMILNALLYSLSLALKGDNIPSPGTRAMVSMALPWVVNLALLIFFAFYRRWIALGALALLGFLLTWVILVGVLFFVACLVLGGVGALFGFFLGGYEAAA
jgi:hypothetical protein